MTLNLRSFVRLCLTALLALPLVGCDSTPIGPDGPFAITETFANLLARGGSASRSFTVRNSGDVTLTLTSLGIADIEVGIALGTHNPETGVCARDFTEVTSVAAEKKIERRFEPGNYCWTVFDIGQMAHSTSFSVTLSHF